MEAVVKFSQVIERGCAVDVHQKSIVTTVMGAGIEQETRTYPTFTEGLQACRSWLQELGITHVAMESTGVYWKPVYHILEEDFQILLVNARHVKYVPGHKTDKKDSEWLAKLLLGGLLKGSFIPEAVNRDIRDLYRYKKNLVSQAAAERNRVYKVLEDANLKLTSVMSDVFGRSGRQMLEAIVAGETDSELLAQLARGPLRRKLEELKSALQGNIRQHHRHMLRLHLELLEELHKQIGEVDRHIDSLLEGFKQEIELLETIPGVGKNTATAIVAEMGTDMSRFPTEKHLASWAGLCPGHNESAGRKKSSRITHGNRTLKTALVEAAWGAVRTKNSYLRSKYYQLATRRGKKKALMAIAHKLLKAAYFVLKDGVVYKEPEGYKKSRRSQNQSEAPARA